MGIFKGLFDRSDGAAAECRTDRQRTGAAAEDAALAHLRDAGLTLIERNFRCRGGELDLVMRQGNILVFVEVRARADIAHGGALASITPAKQRRLLLAAETFLQRYSPLPPCRFDVVAFDDGQLLWLRDAIQA